MSKNNEIPMSTVAEQGLLRGSTLTANGLFAVIDEVLRIQGRLKSFFAGIHFASDLPTMGRVVLSVILESPRPATVSQIGRSLGHPRQVIQRAVNELLAKGLVERIPNPEHKRADLLQPSAKALELKSQSDAAALAVADEFFTGFDAERCHAMAAELRDLRKALQAFSRDRGDA